MVLRGLYDSLHPGTLVDEVEWGLVLWSLIYSVCQFEYILEETL